jgi:branched-subunit amino acid aminotransferase/4-amino-4-deoxychorismate lyase
MPTRIIHNQRLQEATRARLHAITAATLYGCGVFTTLAVYHSEPFLWPQHWARLAEHAARVGMALTGVDEESVRASLLKLIAANEVNEGRARVTLLQNAERGLWHVESEAVAPVEILILTGEARSVGDEGIALTTSPYRINTLSPLAGIKSVNYMEHLISLEEARTRDFDEAVMLNERGEVVAATMANIFWMKHGTLHTPPLATGAISGTTRAEVIALAGELSVPFVENISDLGQLADADEIFLTSAGLGVAIVTTFDFHRYTVGVGSVALRLREAFRQLTIE